MILIKAALVLGAASATVAGGVHGITPSSSSAVHHVVIVRSGDTLSGIALRYCHRRSAYHSLAAANGIRNPNLIYRDQRIVIRCGKHIKHVRVTAPAATPPSSSVHAAHLAPLPINTELRGSQATAWARASLRALGAPRTAANIQTMKDWFSNEGTPHDFNNPLNLQTPHGGSTVSTADNDPPEDRIQAYPRPSDFVAAFPIEMTSGSYGAIVSSLRAGRGLEGSAASSEIASELETYSGNGYNSIPA